MCVHVCVGSLSGRVSRKQGEEIKTESCKLRKISRNKKMVHVEDYEEALKVISVKDGEGG